MILPIHSTSVTKYVEANI